jgi:hypothetical protein
MRYFLSNLKQVQDESITVVKNNYFFLPFPNNVSVLLIGGSAGVFDGMKRFISDPTKLTQIHSPEEVRENAVPDAIVFVGTQAEAKVDSWTANYFSKFQDIFKRFEKVPKILVLVQESNVPMTVEVADMFQGKLL